MRVIPVSTQALLEAQTLVVRDFMRITGRVRATGAPITEGFWSDVGDVSAQVMDADTGLPVTYDFKGVGALIAIDPIPMVSNLTVQEVEVKFSQLDDRINELLRLYDIRQAKVEIYRGEFDPDTWRMVEPAASRFVGFVDGAPVETPAEGGEGSISIKCMSSAQELTRGNPDLRSHESQQVRSPGDDFYKDVTSCGDLVIFWGKRGTVRDAAGA
ncbi:hypothetical protein SAMN05444149_108107 [Pseudosulfitobacter pseudonitzschiae]|uniref:Uncharacterized protein n=1 Tax=Pseudosulfitobacter pseudonitzschiae TaxID=1402135 RepID=A0A073IW41_9RHOB|nr:hypothetical protein [Pseudosulfitobacter pseudonitzschiae]KEJ93989.1 hypothetical protein SUH3_12015 [Pseudosulfitobacter pseudonitzschiae]SHG01846.1 hypothetical protein SAMN05444149_108107 [Pseudosulfitobacter pseudonitzschiae]